VSATSRARKPSRAETSRPTPDPEAEAQFVDSVGSQRGQRLAERLAQASEALDRERFDEARRISSSIVKEAPDVAAAQEVLGLSSYRIGRYKQAVKALAEARDLRENPSLLPVIADSYRALRRYSAVDRTWQQIKEASPAPSVMSEGRIVAAGALADQNDIAGAIELIESAQKKPKRVRDHHLREWYVLGDLYDRYGDPLAARRWFALVADRDPEFVDVAERLRTLGR